MKIENCANTYAVAAPHLPSNMYLNVCCDGVYLPGTNCFLIEDRNSYLIQLIICKLFYDFLIDFFERQRDRQIVQKSIHL